MSPYKKRWKICIVSSLSEYRNVNNEDEHILLSAFLKGDKNAFSSIYNKYVDELFAYGLGLGFERETLKDAIQDTFFRFYTNKKQLQEVIHLKYYLFQATDAVHHRPGLQGRWQFIPFILGPWYEDQLGMTRDLANGRPYRRHLQSQKTMLALFDRKNDARFYKSFKWSYLANRAGAGVELGDTAIYYSVNPATETYPYKYFAWNREDVTKNNKYYPPLLKYFDPLRLSTNDMQGGREWVKMRLAETYLIVAEAAGMTELLRYLPADNADRPRILEGYLLMMKNLKDYQLPDGMWSQLVDDPACWAETSGTAMFTYAMITGVKQGWLNKEEYAPVARKAWMALIPYINAEGDVTEVCVGTNKKDDKQYYYDRPRIVGDYHGQAPVLWCCFALME